MTLSQYFICFVIYSFLGWLYESLFYSFQFRKPVNTGFLHGCICPIYGLACTANVMMLSRIERGATIFLVSMLSISTIEYFVSWTLETLFDKRWWDYSDWPVNLNGRISLISSLGFGALSLMQMRVIHPAVASIILRIPDALMPVLITITAAVILADILCTVKGMDKENDRLWFVTEESPMIRQANKRFSVKLQGFSERCSDMRQYIKDRINK